jgi:hypothetical protein
MKVLILNLLILGLSVFLWFCEFFASKSVEYGFSLTWAKFAVVVSIVHFLGSVVFIFNTKGFKLFHRFSSLGFAILAVILNSIIYVWFVSGI